jgi:hypothetical protein
MASDVDEPVPLETAHVLFADIVGLLKTNN